MSSGGRHRYGSATFHEGAHRLAPGDSTPWRDVSSPMNRVRGWWLAPAAKGSMLAAWCITIIVASFCYTLQRDARGTYMLNTVLLRNLHQETQRADASEERVRQLQAAIPQSSNSGAGGEAAQTAQTEGAVNYELELCRTRRRADATHARNETLLSELRAVRQELAQARRDNEMLAARVAQMKDGS